MSDVRRTDAVLLLVALVWGSSYLSAQTATAAPPRPAGAVPPDYRPLRGRLPGLVAADGAVAPVDA
ncbi:hypothetical protein STAFG_0082 [Streptomyces afghaniensis 772]|uniref:EamA family transporter n=1 Tax=Streptomyces afghaniensis 772 TaxID=1283301 RepID=S4N4B3_9ACTN|nr:hypothetical protein STAFG_0082 [Streptomyces afghaniensis 772]